MKVGHIIDGLEVVDVKRVNKMNLIQFTKAVSEYVELGYKIDVHSSRQVGLVLQCDMYKLENNFSGSVGSTEDVITKSPELTAEAHSDVMLPVTEPNETTIEAIQESTEKLETIVDEVIEESLSDLKDGDVGTVLDETEVEAVEVEQTTAPVKKTRSKKTT